MSEILVRKAEAELLMKWRKRMREEKVRAFEHSVLGQCIRELEETVIEASALPDEERWVETLIRVAAANANNTEENKYGAFRSTLRGYRWALFDSWSKRDGQ